MSLLLPLIYLTYLLFVHRYTHVTESVTVFILAPIHQAYIEFLILLSGNIHTNPGPRNNSFKFATWNVDSILSREKCKLNYISAIDSVHKFDIFGVCETYLGPTTDVDQLSIPGFQPPFRADCTDNDGRPKGGVCLFYKDHIPIKNRNDLATLDETIVAEIRLKSNKKVFLVLTYRTPSKSSVIEIDNFCNSMSQICLLYTSPSPRDRSLSRMPSSA